MVQDSGVKMDRHRDKELKYYWIHTKNGKAVIYLSHFYDNMEPVIRQQIYELAIQVFSNPITHDKDSILNEIY